jgi:hypothetical protein
MAPGSSAVLPTLQVGIFLEYWVWWVDVLNGAAA